jgi:hypothetical protein
MQRGQHLMEAHVSEVHTSGVHAPLKDTIPNTELQPRSSSQLSSTMWGPLAPIPTSQRPQAGLTHSRERRSTRKECLVSWEIRKTVHNQWTQTIAIGLHTLQRLYNYTRPNRTETGCHWFQAVPYDWSPSKWIVPSCVSESGAASTVELVLPARGPSKLWNPSPTSSGRSLLRRNAVSHHDHTDPPTGRVLSTMSLTPHPAQYKAGGLYGKSQLKQGQLTIGP